MLLAVAQDRYLDRLSLVGAQGTIPVGGSGNAVGANLEDHVKGLESGRGGLALARHLLDHQPAGHTKVVGHLRCQGLNQRTDVEAAAEERHVEAAGAVARRPHR